MGRLARRLLDDLLVLAARLVARVFFRDVEVVGAERRPRGAPALVLANHVNSLIDPLLIMAYGGGRLRFLAKSTLWSHPVVAPLVRLAGALPVYRHKDGADVSRNFDTFARCADVLSQRGAIAIFPEGRSHNEPGTVPLKTGAARIALEAEARRGAASLCILPVGLVYEEKERFRSRVLVQIGEPIDPAPEAARYEADPRGAVRDLTARIGAGLEAVTAPFNSWEEARLIDRAVDVATEGDPARLPLSKRWTLWRTFLARYEALAKSNPARAQRLVAALRTYEDTRVQLGLRDTDLATWPERGRHVRAREGGERALLAAGLALNWLPYRLPGWIARRFTRTPDEAATYKVLAALIAFPAWWALEGALAARLFGAAAAVVVVVLAIGTGYAALLVQDRRRLRPRPVGTRFAERAALRDARAALRRRIREVAGAPPW